MRFPHGFPVTVKRAGGHDRHGIALPGSEHLIANCARDQVNTGTTNDGTLVVATTERLLCDDPTADVREGDSLILPDGSRWTVTGEIDRPRSPFTGWAGGCVIPIEHATGARAPQETNSPEE